MGGSRGDPGPDANLEWGRASASRKVEGRRQWPVKRRGSEPERFKDRTSFGRDKARELTRLESNGEREGKGRIGKRGSDSL